MAKIKFNQVEWIFIDFDGTLVDTVPILYNHYLQFLKTYGYDGTMEEFKDLMGPAIVEFVPILKEKYKLTPELPELIHHYTEGLTHRYAEAAFMQGAQDFLEYAKSKNLKMALVTSTDYSILEKCLETLNLKTYFDYIVTGDKVKKSKPNPEIYLLALNLCSARPEKTLALEDSFNGIQASLQAKIPTIAIKNIHLTKIPEGILGIEDWEDLLQQMRINYEA